MIKNEVGLKLDASVEQPMANAEQAVKGAGPGRNPAPPTAPPAPSAWRAEVVRGRSSAIPCLHRQRARACIG